MHDDEAGAGCGGQLRNVRLPLQAVHVVDDMRAGRHRQPRRFGPVGVDGNDESSVRGKRLDDRQDAGLFLAR